MFVDPKVLNLLDTWLSILFPLSTVQNGFAISHQHSQYIYMFDQQGWYGMFVACGIWCLADVSSVSPSSEQT